jgi:hypothetical protein
MVIEVPNLPIDVNSWGRYYPLSDDLSTWHRWITTANFLWPNIFVVIISHNNNINLLLLLLLLSTLWCCSNDDQI